MPVLTEKTAVPSSRGTEIVEIKELGATAQTVKSSAGSVYFLKVDNTKNPTQDVWVKLYNNATPTVGTTVPELWVRTNKGKEQWFEEGFGWAFSTAITAACVKTGGTGGTDAPDNAVDVTIYIN